MIVNCPEQLAEVRLRLSDISWWMRILCQKIAIRANDEALSAPSDLPVATRYHFGGVVSLTPGYVDTEELATSDRFANLRSHTES